MCSDSRETEPWAVVEKRCQRSYKTATLPRVSGQSHLSDNKDDNLMKPEAVQISSGSHLTADEDLSWDTV